MNIAQRLATYEVRGFTRETAAVNVLLEESLRVLFAHYPETFVFFGGASLVLFYGSTRHSGDLDLLVASADAPDAGTIAGLLERPLSEVSAALGLTALNIDAPLHGGGFAKPAVRAGQQALFTIDLTRIGSVIRSEVVRVPVTSDPDEHVRVAIPSLDLQLLYKAEAFLSRRFLKARDAFDIKVLCDTGAQLRHNLKAHLADGPAGERLDDPAFIRRRIEQVNARACQPELKPFLPPDIYRELEKLDFAPLREALQRLFAAWL